MDSFHSLHAFMLHVKPVTYLLMGGGFAAFGCFWLFLFERDKDGGQ